MRLIQAQVRYFKNILDSTVVDIEPTTTCLVGKNESGKTAFLEALWRLNPHVKSEFRESIEFSRWIKRRVEREVDNLPSIVPITASFELRADQLSDLSSLCKADIPESVRVVATRSYGGELLVLLDYPKPSDAILIATAHLIDEGHLSAEEVEAWGNFDEAVQGCLDLAAKLSGEGRIDDPAKKAVADLRKFTRTTDLDSALGKKVADQLVSWLPTFFYFPEYDTLPGRIDITDLFSRSQTHLTGSERVAVSLLAQAGINREGAQSPDFEIRTGELEAAAADISREVFEYWTHNVDLRVSFLPDVQIIESPEGDEVAHRFIDVRLYDERHQMTTNFSTRSAGFQWFFSFIAAFSEYERSNRDVVILLDEPGLRLHGLAQKDFLRFIDERLGVARQTIYSTHSPFMVNPSGIERARLVADNTTKDNPDLGAKITTDLLSDDPATLFPLYGALGFEISQHLVIGAGSHLIVEGTSDFAYLDAISQHLAGLGKVGLAPAFRIVPVGGVDLIPTFVALLGIHLDLSVLVDGRPTHHQKLTRLIDRGVLDKQRLVTCSQVSSVSRADIEDLFTVEDYLALFNGAFGTEYSESNLPATNERILSRLEQVHGAFNHGLPADWMLRNRPAALDRLSDETIQNFESLLELLNNTIS